MTAFLLVHSPIVGPDTWGPVAAELRSRGHVVIVPDLPMHVTGEHWAAHTAAIAAAAEAGSPAGTQVTVAAHSGAGQLLAPAAAALRQRDLNPGAYLLVDAGIPTRGFSRLEQLRAESPGFADELEAVFAAGGRFPAWPEELLAGLVPDDERRARLTAGVRQLPLDYWTERIPDNPTWPDAPCGVLLFSAGERPDPAPYARGLGGASFSSVASSRVKSSGDVKPL